MIEKSILWDGIPSIQNEDDFCRIYFGNEFCEKRLPDAVEISRIIHWASENNKGVTFLSPYSTDEGINNIKKIVRQLHEKCPGAEVVINDWGVLQILMELGGQFELVLGRLLVSRYLNILHMDSDKACITTDLTFPESFISFLQKKKIKKIEFNFYEHFECVRDQLKQSNIKAHLYYPYVYTATSRYCHAAGGYSSYFVNIDGKCDKRCKHEFAIVKNEKFELPLILDGNTYFLDRSSEDCCAFQGINRIINMKPESNNN